MIWKIIRKILYWLFIVFALYFIIVVFYSNLFAPKLEYKKLENYDYGVLVSLNNLPEFESREQVKKQLEDVFGVHFYIYREVESFSNKNHRGNTFLPLRMITIAKKRTEHLVWYAYVLAHEMAHLKYYNCDERYIEFKVVQVLYESGDENLIKLAKWRTFRQILDERDYIGEYSCAYYCYNYICEKEIN